MFAEASSSSLPGRAKRFERSCFAVRAEHYGGRIQVHRHGHQCCRQGWGSDLKAPPPVARRRHRHAQPIGHAPHPEPTDDAERQSVADHLYLVQSTLQQKIRQQRVRVQAPRTPTTSNPQPLSAWATYPAPVPTPPTKPPPLTIWTWAGMLAHLDLLPQREIG